jgi:hypothetical protein
MNQNQVLTQTLKLLSLKSLNVAAEAATHKDLPAQPVDATPYNQLI